VKGHRDSHSVADEIESATGRRNVGKELAAYCQERLGRFREARLKLFASSVVA